MTIVCRQKKDDHYDFDQPCNNLLAAVSEYCSWGYLDVGENNYVDGYQSPPINWGLNTERKRAYFARVKEIAVRYLAQQVHLLDS